MFDLMPIGSNRNGKKDKDPVPKITMRSHVKGQGAKFEINSTACTSLGIKNTGDEYICMAFDGTSGKYGFFLTDEIDATKFRYSARISKVNNPTRFLNIKMHKLMQDTYGNTDFVFRIEPGQLTPFDNKTYQMYVLEPLIGLEPDVIGDGGLNSNTLSMELTEEEEEALAEQQIADSADADQGFIDWE